MRDTHVSCCFGVADTGDMPHAESCPCVTLMPSHGYSCMKISYYYHQITISPYDMFHLPTSHPHLATRSRKKSISHTSQSCPFQTLHDADGPWLSGEKATATLVGLFSTFKFRQLPTYDECLQAGYCTWMERGRCLPVLRTGKIIPARLQLREHQTSHDPILQQVAFLVR